MGGSEHDYEEKQKNHFQHAFSSKSHLLSSKSVENGIESVENNLLGGVCLRNSNTRARCEKRQLSKCQGVCRTYSDIQFAMADYLEKDDAVKEFVCNYALKDFSIKDGNYTSDFFCRLISGEIVIYECVLQKHLTRAKTVQLLDASRTYWLKRGAMWRLATDASK